MALQLIVVPLQLLQKGMDDLLNVEVESRDHLQTYRVMEFFGEMYLIDIETYTYERISRLLGKGIFDQNATDLAILDVNIIWPFDQDLGIRQDPRNGIAASNGHGEIKEGYFPKVQEFWLEYEREQRILACSTVPLFALLSTSLGLVHGLYYHAFMDGSGGYFGTSKIIGGVDGGQYFPFLSERCVMPTGLLQKNALFCVRI